MGLALTIVGRSLLGRPGRTLFSVLGVAMGIATVVAVFTVDHVSVLHRTRGLDPGWGADLAVRPSAALEDPREILLQLEGVAGVAAFFENDVGFRPLERRSGDDRSRPVQLTAIEAGAARTLGNYHVEHGADLTPGRRDQVLVGRELARHFGLEVGDRVYLAPPARAARKACVEGELRPLTAAGAERPEEVFFVTGILGKSGLGRKGKGHCVIIDYEVGCRLFRDLHVSSQFLVNRDETTDLEGLESDLGASFTFERNEAAVAGQKVDERAFRNGVRMAGLFALLLGLFVIFHTLSMALIERVREVGALHALGTTRLQIARVFFAEALVIATLAGALGFAGGILLAKAMLWKGITTLGVVGYHVRPLVIPWRTVLSLTLLGVSVALVGSIYPILRARGTGMVSAIRDDEHGARRGVTRGFQLFGAVVLIAVVPTFFFFVVPVIGARDARMVGTVLLGLAAVAVLIGIPVFLPNLVASLASALVRPTIRWFPLAGMLAARSLRESASRVGASVTAIALVTTAFVALKGMTASLAGEIRVWGEEAVIDKVWIEDLDDANLDELTRELHTLPGVVGVEQADARVYVGFLLLGVRPGELGGYGPGRDDPSLLRDLEGEQTMVISRRLATQRGLGVGDAVLVNTSGHGVQEFGVTAVTDEYGYFIHPDERAYGIVADRWLRKYFCLETGTTTAVAVRLTEEADPEAIGAVLSTRLPAASEARLTPGSSVLRLHLEDIDRDFILFDIILLLTAVLAGLGTLNGLLLATLERRKELGVLRALGTTDAQVTGAVLLESAAVGVCGGLIGLLVGGLLTPVVVSSLRALSGLDLPLRWAAPALLAAFLLGALLLALLAGLYPIYRMRRMDPVRAVRTG
jgi:putative ABC transport system permease protein